MLLAYLMSGLALLVCFVFIDAICPRQQFFIHIVREGAHWPSGKVLD